MNIDLPKEQNPLAEIGRRLSEARELSNLSQQAVAEQLRLKVTTVRELEEGLNPLGLAPTFIHGYIRSYAKLVQLPADELIALLPKSKGAFGDKTSLESNRIKGFTLGKPRKKLDRWLMLFTWMILFVVLGLTGAWWWENHKAQQNEMTSTAEQNQIAIPVQQQPNTTTPSTNDNQIQNSTSVQNTQPASDNAMPLANSTSGTSALGPTPTLEQAVATQIAENEASNGVTSAVMSPNSNDINMSFTADCWIEVIDARGKNLYSGLQRSGGKMSLTGQAPYRVKLGAPAGVDLVFKGKKVDLTQYKNVNRTARLTLAAE
ncbi:cytoskeleton protein RodZ [Budvicia diplopodorum]|uniref:cytoskeleton protein RodZ n=1 Tax=Budvicia diplopodorum TaxID=1119056 RepID=UPI00135CC16C|nr:cytoskeleton protein RodZ [Budvicia diplopodorum]